MSKETETHGEQVRQPKKFMGFVEFVEEGYLQELNRRILHPVGLEMVIVKVEENKYNITIIDERDFPVGIIYGTTTAEDTMTRINFAKKYTEEFEKRAVGRVQILGHPIQMETGGVGKNKFLKFSDILPYLEKGYSAMDKHSTVVYYDSSKKAIICRDRVTGEFKEMNFNDTSVLFSSNWQLLNNKEVTEVLSNWSVKTAEADVTETKPTNKRKRTATKKA